MNLEKNYYDESERQNVEIQKEVEDDDASLSQSERIQRAEADRKEIDHLFDLAMAQVEQKRKLIDKRKVDRFYRLVKKADSLASRLEANFSAQTSEGYKGIIRLLAPQMIIDESWENGELRSFGRLISASDDMWIDTVERSGKSFVQIELAYNLSGID